MRTLLAIVILFAVCQGHPAHEESHHGPLPLERKLLDMMRISALRKHHEYIRMLPNATTPNNMQPNATTPIINSTNPEQNYDWIKDEYEGLEEALLFPGSHYLADLILEHCDSPINTRLEIDDIPDYFELPECELKVRRKKILKVSKIVEDAEIMSFFSTRYLLEPVFNERMKCPAAILDTAIVRVIMTQKTEFMKTDDDSLYNYLKGEIPKIDPLLANYTDDIAFRAVHLLHGLLFNETIEFIFGYGLKDLAISSHTLYYDLGIFFEFLYQEIYWDLNYDLKFKIDGALWEVQCPTSMELLLNHQKAVWRFRAIFGAIETEHICSRAVDFLHRYVNRTMPGVILNLDNNGALWNVCEGIGQVIDGVIEAYAKYESFLFNMNIRELEQLTREYMSDEEWEILNEAVNKLGFIDFQQERK